MSLDTAISSQHTAKQRGGFNSSNRESARIARIRAAAMAEVYTGGKTLAEIGREYRISGERVRQILSKIGVSGADGRWSIRNAKRRAERAAATNARYLAKSGCTREQWLQIPRNIRHQCRRKRGQVTYEYGARAWALTQWEYYLELKKAGVEISRGGLGMTRIDSNRPFAPGNVKFVTAGSWRKRWKRAHPLLAGKTEVCDPSSAVT